MSQRYDLADKDKFVTATINFHGKNYHDLENESACNVADPMRDMEGRTAQLERAPALDRKGLKFYYYEGWIWSELWLDNIRPMEDEEDFV